jgi:cadmium resistance protein CadD (predicted permease)
MEQSMGDSGLTIYLAAAAGGVILLALIFAVVAWRVPSRPVRIALGTGLILLGLLCVVLSFLATVLIVSLGVAVCTLGVRTAPADGASKGAAS